MQFTTSLLALAALSTSVLAGPHHRHFHQKRNPMPDVFEAIAGTSSAAAATPTTAADVAASPASASSGGSTSQAQTVLSGLGAKAALNPTSNNGQIWLGSDGPYTVNFVNSASEAVTAVVWGPAGSWINAVAPQVAITLPAGASQVVSFANGVSGGWSGIYSGTKIVAGQISNTWGEVTFSGIYSTYDVSREPNMNGNSLQIKAPSCTSNMNTCVFTCTSGTTCGASGTYTLDNCATGSQPGASTGNYDGNPSGGCMGLSSTGALTATFS